MRRVIKNGRVRVRPVARATRGRRATATRDGDARDDDDGDDADGDGGGDEDEEEEGGPRKRVNAVIAPTPSSLKLQLALYLNLARCAAALGQASSPQAVACCTLAGGLAGAAKRLKDKLVAAREAPIFRAMESEEVQ